MRGLKLLHLLGDLVAPLAHVIDAPIRDESPEDVEAVRGKLLLALVELLGQGPHLLVELQSNHQSHERRIARNTFAPLGLS